MEGADPILAPSELAEWHAAGLRLLGPAHYGPGRYAGGTGTEHGFSPMGLELLGEMGRLGVALDVTHLTDVGFWQALERFDGPVLASHSNCRALVPHQRQLDDDQIRALAARGAVIGAALDTWMLLPGWVGGQSTNERVTLEWVADQIDHVCQVTGSARHAAIGSDLDGGFGREQSPRDLDTIADLQRVGEILAARGYAPEDVALVMHGNWLRWLTQAWEGTGQGLALP
jgi:membrane dipeptidase